MVSLQLLGFIASIIFPTVGAIGWLQDRSNKRIDTILEQSNKRVDLVLLHVQKVEAALTDMRADMPVKYTLRDDHIRLAERVGELEHDLRYQYRDREPKPEV